MAKKYQSKIEQTGDTWSAEIVRHVTSRKTTVTKSQQGFESEADAKGWSDTALAELVTKQQRANERQGQQRKENEEIKRQRSSRRAQKTENAKLEKVASDESIKGDLD